MADRGFINTPAFEVLEAGHAPALLSAQAVNSTQIVVVYDQYMNDSVLQAGNYDIQSATGMVGDVVNCTWEVNGVQVRITLNKEMTQDATYQLFVSNVFNISRIPIRDDARSATFSGIGVRPNVVSAEAVSSAVIQVLFDEQMEDSSYLRSAGSYEITPAHVIIGAVNVADNPLIRLSVAGGEMRTGATYTLQVSASLRDPSYNSIDNRTANFQGIGVAPRVTSAQYTFNEALMRVGVWVYFSESMDTATLANKANYSIEAVDPGVEVPAILTVTEVSATAALVVTAAFSSSGTYRIRVSDAVTDLIGNPIDPAYNSATFIAEVLGPPIIDVIPSGIELVDPRSVLQIRFYDDPKSFNGIMQTSIQVGIEYDGIMYSAVANGDPDTDIFNIKVVGDPLAPTGVTYVIIPKTYWPANRYIFGTAKVRDLRGIETARTFAFSTRRYQCIEDYEITPIELELALLNAKFSDVNFANLLDLLLTKSTNSATLYANTRTILFYAAIGPLHWLISDVVDASYANLSLCDRTSIIDLHTLLKPLINGLLLSVKQVAMPDDIRNLFIKHLQHPSPVNVVNAAAALIIHLVHNGFAKL